MKPVDIVREVGAERIAQDAKWGRSFEGRPDQQWLAILMEEVGEAAEEVLNGVHDVGGDHLLEREVIQIAAVCFSWLEFRTPFAEQIRRDV